MGSNGPLLIRSQLLYSNLLATSIFIETPDSKGVFEERTTGSEAISLLICLDATKFILPSFFCSYYLPEILEKKNTTQEYKK